MINLFNNKYPYTDFHELNLDWLLETYQEIVDHVNELLSWMEQHKGEYEEALKRLEAVENEIETFEARINAEFSSLTAQFEKEFADLKAEIEKELADTKEEIIQSFEKAIADFTNDFIALKQEVLSDINTMKIEIRNMITYMNERFVEMQNDMHGYVDDRLEQFIHDLPDYENLIVYNPVQGKQTNVQQAINDLYSAFAVFGLTARQYDDLQLTASEYDNKKLTAREYDLYGYKLLDYPDPQLYMRDPFTGLIVLNKVVINRLADLHRECLTAYEYDHLGEDHTGITAETYDEMQLSAYFYDWYGIRLWDSAITAQEYDDLELTAWDYDSRRITAIQYDNYAKYLLTA